MTVKWIYVLVTPGCLPWKQSGRSRSKPQSLCIQQRPIGSGSAHQNSPWFTHSVCPASLGKCFKCLPLRLPKALSVKCALCIEGASFAFIERMSEWWIISRCGSQMHGHWNPPGGLVKTQIAVPPPPTRVSDSVGLRWGLRICIYNRLPGNREAAGPETTFWEPLM